MIVEVDNLNARIIECSPRLRKKLDKELKVYAPGYRYTWQFKQKKWDGKVNLFGKISFYTGLLPCVLELAAKHNEPVEIRDRRHIPTSNFHATTLSLRDYQIYTVMHALENQLHGTWWPRGIIKLATGGGKTEIAVAMIEMAQVPTLFIVHTRELVEQTVKRLAKYGVAVGVIGTGQFDTSQMVTVATIQTLMAYRHQVNEFRKDDSGRKVRIRSDEEAALIRSAKEDRGEMIEMFLSTIEQVFVDEAHLCAATLDKGNLFVEAMNLLPNAYMRWGLTATPGMRDEYSNWLLEGVTGNQLCNITSSFLIKEGYLTPPEITMFKVPSHESVVASTWQTAYETGVVLKHNRNQKIVELIGSSPGPILILVTREAHGKILSERSGVPFFYGKSSSKDRVKAMEDMASGKLKAAIVSNIWDQGVDIPSIQTLIMAGGGKSHVKTLQRLGRGLRKAEGKLTLKVYDFFDESTRWLLKHSRTRKKQYEAESFEVKIAAV